jgi:ABC-type transporter Mla subunit MlaD
MDNPSAAESVTQALSSHNLIEAIDLAIADADEAKALAQEAIASLDEGLAQLNQLADEALEKYKLL